MLGAEHALQELWPEADHQLAPTPQLALRDGERQVSAHVLGPPAEQADPSVGIGSVRLHQPAVANRSLNAADLSR
jgi:hypothetical protein